MNSKAAKSALPAKAPKKTGKAMVPPETKEETAPVKEKGTSLLVEQPPKKTVVGQRFQAHFLKGYLDKTKRGKLTNEFKITVELSQDHEKVLPDIPLKGYHHIKRGVSGVNLEDIPPHKILFFMTKDNADPSLDINAQIIKSHIDTVQKKGEGEARKVIRWVFSALTEQSQATLDFCGHNHHNNFWLEMDEIEPDLLDLDEAEEDEE